mgnify:FL=1|nr:MAG TPA: hypothetical protein [Caudoviricetes sp.]
MFSLIQGRYASMWELKNAYNLDEALTLYDLVRMQNDIERISMKRMNEEGGT